LQKKSYLAQSTWIPAEKARLRYPVDVCLLSS